MKQLFFKDQTELEHMAVCSVKVCVMRCISLLPYVVIVSFWSEDEILAGFYVCLSVTCVANPKQFMVLCYGVKFILNISTAILFGILEDDIAQR